MFLRQTENMHCSYNPNIAASLLASSPGSGVGRSFCSNRSLIVKIKAHVFLKYQLGAESCLGSPPPNTHTVRMYAGIGRRHMREGRGRGLSERGLEGWKERPQRQTGFLLRTARVAVSFLSVWLIWGSQCHSCFCGNTR